MAEKPKKKLSDGTLVDVDIAAKTAECDGDGNDISSTYLKVNEKCKLLPIGTSNSSLLDKGYDLLVFEIIVYGKSYYTSVPATPLVINSIPAYLTIVNPSDGSIVLLKISAKSTGFDVTAEIGEITIDNVNVYAYK